MLMSLGFGFMSMPHDFHLSKTDIHYKTDQEAIQFTIHAFIDDIELALSSYEDLDYNLFEDKEHPLADSILLVYLREKLSVELGGTKPQLDFVGREISDDFQGLWAYFEIGDISTFEEISIRNNLLMETHDDQRNIINFKVDNKSKAFHILTKSDDHKEIKL